MRLVIDASIIFSVLIKRDFSYRLLARLGDMGSEMYSPAWLEEELENGKEKILRYSGLDESKLDFFVEAALGKITVASPAEYEKYFAEAKELAPHPEDAPYFALALAKGCPIWSNEKAFKRQPAVRVLSSTEIEWMLQ